MLERYRTMKNSLLKRAIAAAAAVPLALVQCPTYVNAVTTDTVKASANVQADSEQGTLDAFLAIPGDSLNFNKEGNQVSTWEQTAITLLGDIAGKSGEIDVKSYADTVSKNAGDYGEIAEYFLNEILSDVKYEVTPELNVEITGKIAEPDWNKNLKNTAGEALDVLAGSYGVPALTEVDFSSIKAGGSFKIKINSSELNYGRKLSVEFEYDCNNGKKYSFGEFIGFVNETIDKTEELGLAEIEKQIPAELADKAKASYSEKIQLQRDMVAKAEKAIDKALSANKSGSSQKENGNAADIIAKANSWLKAHNIDKQIPPTATDIAADERVSKAFDKLVAETNGKVNLTAAELGAFADSIGRRSIEKDGVTVKSTDLTYSVSNGFGTFVAAFDDNADEQAVLDAMLRKDGYQLVDSYKKITAKVDFSKVKDADGAGTVELNIERVFVTDTYVTTTVSTTTSATSTSATETTSTTATDTETTSTTATDTETTSTTATNTETTSTTATDTGTTSTTATDIGTTSTTATNTETTSTTATDNETTTTTVTDTTTTAPVVTTTTTLPVEQKKIKLQYAKAGYTKTEAFYLNTEEEFNKDQVSDLTLITVYDDDTSVETEVDPADINFGTATPANTYEKDNERFHYLVQVYVNDIKLLNEDGGDFVVSAYIGVRGDADLDSKADAIDASVVLTYYATLQTGGTPYSTKLSTSSLATSARNVYDEFAAYLCDVQHDVSFNNLTRKGTRNKTINAVDAATILTYYAKRQIAVNASKTDAQLWAEIDRDTNNTSETNE